MSKTIWVIDDDAITRFMIQKTLSRAPFESDMVEFANGADALEAIRERSRSEEALPDIVLLDITMPVMDGWDFLRELDLGFIKGLDKVNFLILTSSMDPLDEKKGKANKYVKAFLRKPLNINEFLNALGVLEQNGG